MELTPLRYFVHVATQQSFVAGARSAHVTPPALSKAIRALEDELGARLFERTTRAVKLTHAGTVLLDQARSIVAQADSLRLSIAAAAGEVRGELRIGAMEVFSLGLLPAALTRVVTAHPELVPLAYEMPPDDQLAALERGLLDVALTVGGGASQALAREVLGLSPGVIVVGRGHPLYGVTTATAATRKLLVDARWVVPRFFGRPGGAAIDQFPDAAWPRQVGATIELLRAGVELTAGGRFVACFPVISIRRELAEGRLWRVRGGPRIAPFELAVFTRKDALPSPAVAALVAALRRELRTGTASTAKRPPRA